MNNGNGRLGRLYDRLEPEERFRLAIDAGARGDEDTRRRLVDGCPEAIYRLSDPAFTDRCVASRTITDVALIELLPQAARLTMVTATLQLVDETLGHTAESHAGSDAQEVEALRDALVRQLLRVEVALTTDLATVFAAFAATCREDMGLEPETVMRAHFGPFYEQLLPLDELRSAAPDQARVAEWRAVFARGWRGLSRAR